MSDPAVPGPGKAELRLADRLALRPREVALVLGVSDRTVREWMCHEGLPYLRLRNVVLIPCAELEAWLAEKIVSDRRADETVSQILSDLE